MSSCCHGDGFVQEGFPILRLVYSCLASLSPSVVAGVRLLIDSRKFTQQYVCTCVRCYAPPRLYIAFWRRVSITGHHQVGRLGAFHGAVPGLVRGTWELVIRATSSGLTRINRTRGDTRRGGASGTAAQQHRVILHPAAARICGGIASYLCIWHSQDWTRFQGPICSAKFPTQSGAMWFTWCETSQTQLEHKTDGFL